MSCARRCLASRQATRACDLDISIAQSSRVESIMRAAINRPPRRVPAASRALDGLFADCSIRVESSRAGARALPRLEWRATRVVPAPLPAPVRVLEPIRAHSQSAGHALYCHCRSQFSYAPCTLHPLPRLHSGNRDRNRNLSRSRAKATSDARREPMPPARRWLPKLLLFDCSSVRFASG